MDISATSKPRPYWHVDAKWITGILLLFLLNATFLLFILMLVTAPDMGIDLLTVALASSFSREGLDQKADMEIMHEKIAESPNGEWQPIPSLNIVVREEDITGLTPREMRLWFFRQLAEPIYYEGSQGLANLSTDPDLQNNTETELGLVGFISAETHSKLQRFMYCCLFRLACSLCWSFLVIALGGWEVRAWWSFYPQFPDWHCSACYVDGLNMAQGIWQNQPR